VTAKLTTIAAAALAAAVTATTLLTATSAAAANSVRANPAAVASAGNTAANKALVVYVYNQLFNRGNTSVIDKYVSPDYIQHNPTIANGPDALRQLVETLHASNPDSRNVIEHVIAQGDLVLLQTDAGVTATSKGAAIVDVFRVQNGKLAEHWDTIQPVPATTVSGHDMFSTLSLPATATPGPEADTATNESIVLSYLRDLAGKHDLSAVSRYVSPSLYQHDPTLADGAAATEKAYADLFAEYPDYTATVAKVVAQGDLVAVHTHVQDHPGDLGTSVYEIFRVQHGKIVEHWSDTQNVPATSVNGNSMF
jgi:predicted SnoaL-like aldol condensation-catalyzing enzyme